MIKSIVIGIMMLLVVSGITPAYAEDLDLVDPGITPDSAFYPLDVFFDDIGVALAFGNENKLNKQLDVAEERLAEVNAMLKANNTECAQEAIENHNALMEHVRVRINGSDNATENLRVQLKIEERLNIHQGNILDVGSELSSEDQGLVVGMIDGTGAVKIKNDEEKGRIKLGIENAEVVEADLKQNLDSSGNNQVANQKGK